MFSKIWSWAWILEFGRLLSPLPAVVGSFLRVSGHPFFHPKNRCLGYLLHKVAARFK